MKMLITALSLLMSFYSFTQTSISNTKWKGQITKPQSLEIVLEFKTDSLRVTSAEGAELEVMYFLLNRDTLTIKKLNGSSPCDNVTEGAYLLKWFNNGEKFQMNTIKDDCRARSNSITSGAGYLRAEE